MLYCVNIKSERDLGLQLHVQAVAYISKNQPDNAERNKNSDIPAKEGCIRCLNKLVYKAAGNIGEHHRSHTAEYAD